LAACGAGADEQRVAREGGFACAWTREASAQRAKIVQEAERCRASGEIGSSLRREGLFSSQLTDWKSSTNPGRTRHLRPGVVRQRSGALSSWRSSGWREKWPGLRRKLDHAEQL